MTRPASSIVLVHGAGSGPWVFDGWAASLDGLTVATPDLHEGLDVARASMADYAARVSATASRLPRPVALCGWSMGGLAVLMAAEAVRPAAVVLLEPSPPGEVQGFDPGVEPEPGTFDPEELYGRFPPGMAARPESALARAERKRGISVPKLPSPSLVVYGDDFPEDRGRAVARLYGSEELCLAARDHWQLVLDPRAAEAVAQFARGYS
jgi:pimeloyl-ACP methyl ester carboxylesterase